MPNRQRRWIPPCCWLAAAWRRAVHLVGVGWREAAQILAFVARRLEAESVAMILSIRDPGAMPVARLPELVLEGLPNADARTLLALVIPGRIDERVRDRIVAEAGGNPLALLELPRGITAAELAGGFGVAGELTVTGRIEQSFQRRIAPLPEMTRSLLLLAAAEPVGDPARRRGPGSARRARADLLRVMQRAVPWYAPTLPTALAVEQPHRTLYPGPDPQER